MQGTWSSIITFWASLVAPVTNAEVAKTNTSFLALEAPDTWWIVALLIAILAGYLGRVWSIFSLGVAGPEGFGLNSNSQGGTFLSLAIFSIPLFVLFLLFLSFLEGVTILRTLRSLSLRFLRPRTILVNVLGLPCRLISLGRPVASRTAIVYFFY